MLQDVSIISFNSFLDFEDYLLQRHIMIPQTKSIGKLKLYSDCGYKLLFRDLAYPSNILFLCKIFSKQDLLECMKKASALKYLHPDRVKSILAKHNYQESLLTNRYKIVKSKDFETLKKFDIHFYSHNFGNSINVEHGIYHRNEYLRWRPKMKTWQYNFGAIFYGYYFFTYD